MTGEVRLSSRALCDLVRPRPPLECLVTGLGFAEGPAWDCQTGSLVVSDIPNDCRLRWSPLTGSAVDKRPTRKGNGLTFDLDGCLIVCEHDSNSLVREHRSGREEVLASRYNGLELNSPNDVIVTADGSIYFTDPTYGRWPVYGIEREPELPFRGVFRLSSEGRLELLRDDFDMPNGLCFSPDETVLYVNDTAKAHVRRFVVNRRGGLESSDILLGDIGRGVIDEGVVDGMKCDAAGNVWVTGPDGIWVIDPHGTLLGILETPERAGNLTWGEADWKTLFLACSTSVYRLRTEIAGAAPPYAAGYLRDGDTVGDPR